MSSEQAPDLTFVEKYIATALVTDYCKYLEAKNLTELLDLFHDDCTVQVAFPESNTNIFFDIPATFYEYKGKAQLREWLKGEIDANTKLVINKPLTEGQGYFASDDVTVLTSKSPIGTGMRGSVQGQVKDFLLHKIIFTFDMNSLLEAVVGKAKETFLAGAGAASK
ncbi:hypothetical protein HDV05_004408 [Chytridiales sp. JEL 0842]|nr:hypothetical protein HDV05_004408 [Chytridiales sp. JEL 0842]